MTSLDPLGPLLAQIRERAAGLRDRAAGKPAPGSPSSQAPEGLLDRVAAKVAHLPAELPDRRRRAFRVFLEEVLAHELPLNRSSAGYQELVDRVLSSMQADGRLREGIERAADALIEMSRDPRSKDT